ncbi:MAG: protein translocase subunit SecF [Dehalococcoidia bacterium]
MDIVGKRFWYFLLSAVVIIPGIIALVIPPALKLGVDFTGGSALTLTFAEPVTESQVRGQMIALGHPEATIQAMGDRSVFIRTALLREAVVEGDRIVEPSEWQAIQDAVEESIGPIESRQLDTVSPVVAQETVRNAGFAVLAAVVGILLYITWAFRGMRHSFRYGVAAILALVHDVLLVVGIFSILGKVVNLEVNAMFITGLLTVLGYSVNDTIVVFDRIRENAARGTEVLYEDVVNTSILQTIGRSLNTSLTSLTVLLALLLFGGPTIRPLLLALLIGIAAGTYSSVFIASQFLVIWERRELGRFLPFRRPARVEAP